MNTFQPTIEEFSEDEQKIIEKAIDKLRMARHYSLKPCFWHDMILLGCESLLTDKKGKR